MNAEKVRELLLDVWGRQACQRQSDWPEVLSKLMQDVGSGNGKRASFKPRIEEAVARLTEAFSARRPPADPTDLVWRSFPMLTRPSCAELARLLIAEAAKPARAKAAA